MTLDPETKDAALADKQFRDHLLAEIRQDSYIPFDMSIAQMVNVMRDLGAASITAHSANMANQKVDLAERCFGRMAYEGLDPARGAGQPEPRSDLPEYIPPIGQSAPTPAERAAAEVQDHNQIHAGWGAITAQTVDAGFAERVWGPAEPVQRRIHVVTLIVAMATLGAALMIYIVGALV